MQVESGRGRGGGGGGGGGEDVCLFMEKQKEPGMLILG